MGSAHADEASGSLDDRLRSAAWRLQRYHASSTRVSLRSDIPVVESTFRDDFPVWGIDFALRASS
jgi:hypothetical protein